MKSIKPGRGPSKMGMVGGIFAALFGIFWCILALSMGAWFMVPFGVIFIGVAVYNVVYNYRNVTSQNRYSIVDIVDDDEETDPLNEKYGRKSAAVKAALEENGTTAAYCPYCGTSVNQNFEFCPKCGRQLPD